MPVSAQGNNFFNEEERNIQNLRVFASEIIYTILVHRYVIELNRIFLLVLLVASVSSSFGQQKYIPFPDSGSVWVMQEGGKKAGNLTVGGDTLINGTKYQIIYYTYYPSPVDELLYYTSIREDTVSQRVYVLVDSMGYDVERLLYDFSLKVGDTIPESHLYASGWKITSIDTLVLKNNRHRIFNVQDTTGIYNVYPYVEGIGCVTGPFSSPSIFEHTTWLICFTPDGLPYYPNTIDSCVLYNYVPRIKEEKNKVYLYPNPSSNFDKLVLYWSKSDLPRRVLLFDSYGANLGQVPIEIGLGSKFTIDSGSLTKGVYFLRIEDEKGNWHGLRLIRI